MSTFLNLGSLILGLAAWVIPIAAISMRKKRPLNLFSIYSFSFCAAALLFQLLQVQHLVRIGDLSAIMDTIRATCIAAVVLVVVTGALNLIAARLCSRLPVELS